MGLFEDGFQGFCPLPRLYAIIALQDLLSSQDHFFTFLDDCLCCLCDLSMEYFDVRSFTISTTGVIDSLVFLIFSLCHEWSTFFIRTCLPLCYGFILGWFPLCKLLPSFVFHRHKSKNLVPPFMGKTLWDALYVKQQNWAHQIYLEIDRPQQFS